MLSGQALYQQLSSMNLGATSDDQFRSMGFSNGRQGAIDALSSLRNQYDPQAIAAQAQAAQVAANQPAIATLQSQGTTLADQYKTLLADVTNQGNAAFNTATSGENAFLGARGLLSQGGVGNNQLSQAQNTINTTNATNEQNVTTAGALTQSQIAEQIAALQAGNLPQAENFSQNILNTNAGITNTNTQAQEALAQAKLAYTEPYAVSPGNIIFSPATGNQTRATGGGGNIDISHLVRQLLQNTKTQARQPASSISRFVQ